jgi:hypothetical protein
MKNTLRTLAASTLVLALAAPSLAADAGHGSMKGMDHGSMKGMEMKEHGQHAAEWGPAIHESSVEGYTITYHLMDNRAAMAKMGDMKGHDMSQMKSHHLMVFIAAADGKRVEEAKVGYKVEGPSGEQKTMAMAMKGGFGADVELGAKGTYEIKTKAVVGDKSLVDEFKYDVR